MLWPPSSSLYKLSEIPQSRCIVYLDYFLAHAVDFQNAVKQESVFLAICRGGLCLYPAFVIFFGKRHSFWGMSSLLQGCPLTLLRWHCEGLACSQQFWNTEVLPWPGILLSMVHQGRCHHCQPSILLHLTQKSQVFHWGEDCGAVFVQLHSALVKAPVLSYPDPHLPAWDGTVPEEENGEQVLTYYSHNRLINQTKKHCVTHQKLLTVVLELRPC